jgi:hypothetical protein
MTQESIDFSRDGLTPEFSGPDVRRLRRRGDYIAGSRTLTICNVVNANQGPLQRDVRPYLTYFKNVVVSKQGSLSRRG